MTTEALGSLLLVGIAVVALLGVMALPRIGQRAAAGADTLVRLSAVAAVSSAISSLMYVVYFAVATPITLAAGDAFMAAAPWLLWASVRAVADVHRYRVSLIVAVAVPSVTAALSLTLPPELSSDIKLVLMAIGCLLTFVETRRGVVHATPGSALVGGAALAYGVFCVLRVVGTAVLGEASVVYRQALDTNAASVAGGVAVIFCAAGVIMMRLALVPRGTRRSSADDIGQLARALLQQGQVLTAVTVRLRDLGMIRAAYGGGVADQVAKAGVDSTAAALPDALIASSPSGGTVVALTVGRRRTAAAAESIRRGFGQRVPAMEGADAGELEVTRATVADDAGLTRMLADLDRRADRWDPNKVRSATAVADLLPIRTIWLNQLLLAASVAVISLAVVIIAPSTYGSGMFAVGIAAILVVTAATMAIPWRRAPIALIVLVPLADILAIGALDAGASAPLGFLWAFPVIWIAMSFSGYSLAAAYLVIAALVIHTVQLDPTQLVRGVIVVTSVVFVGLSTHIAARQNLAFRSLIGTQATSMRASALRAQDAQRRTRQLLDAVELGLARIDASGSLAVVNDALVRMYGLDRDDLAQPPRSIDYDDQAGHPVPERDRPLARALRGEEFAAQQVWLFDAEAEWHALSVTSTRLDGDGEPEMLFVARDVTAEVTAQREQARFIAMATHEMRHPLTAILGNAELALDGGELSPAGARRMTVIHDSSERLIDLINDVIAGKRLAKKQAPADEATFDLHEIVLQSTDSFAVTAQNNAVALDVALDGPLPVVGDAFRIRQVVDNLVSNAIKYTREGGHVTVHGTRERGQVTVSVSDDGIGMSPDEVARVFDPYFRADTARQTASGTGLGMNITRDILRAHGGHIVIDSRKDVGTVVTIELPAAEASADPAVPQGELHRSGSTP